MECPDYHFIAIGGIGQSALARILLKEGKIVSGSDISKSKYVLELEKLGAQIYIGHNEQNLKGRPVVVLSTAIKDDNPELIKAKELGLKIIHRSDLLKEISLNYPCFIGFSGTHGKTTTSGMASYLLSKIGKKPCYAVGGVVPELCSNGDCEDNNTPYFVAELDESDGTILKYSPKITVVNNLEADHFDFYKNGLDDILDTFSKFLSNLADGAKVLINIDNDANNLLISKNPAFNFVTYSIKSQNADYYVKNVQYSFLSSSFDVFCGSTLLGNVKLNIPGEHNVVNALAVCVALVEAGVDFNEFAKVFGGFSGMGRRFQKAAEFNSVVVIDDYAHHPTEIKATLDAVKEYKEGRIVSIFQPHRYSRFLGLYEEFLSSFEKSDVIFVTDVYAAGEQAILSPNVDDFALKLSGSGKISKHFSGNIEQAAKQIIEELQPNDLVFTFGAGDITKMGKALEDEYSKRGWFWP